jgi:NAD-dependent oxidoreductase involved in siderophore biosynthesis
MAWTLWELGSIPKKKDLEQKQLAMTYFKHHFKRRKRSPGILDQYGGKLYNGYEEIATSSDIDALYIPLPPSLHFKWAKMALEHGKHVLVEKPSTTEASDTKELVEIASEHGLALHENYMFTFHEQLDAIEEIIRNGEIGDIRLYRISFASPAELQMTSDIISLLEAEHLSMRAGTQFAMQQSFLDLQLRSSMPSQIIWMSLK